MREQRIQQMAEFIKAQQMSRLDTLSERFDISISTTRRDVDELVRLGLVEKVYGGVRYLAPKTKAAPFATVPYPQREVRHAQEKDIIGRLAAELFRDQETVFIDSGTTTIRVISHAGGRYFNVLTNNLNVVNACYEHDSISVFVPGGELYRLTSSFVGDKTIEFLNKYNVSVALLAATGVSLEHGFTNSSPLETTIKSTAIRRSMRRYVLVDYSKWDVVSLSTYATFEDITGVVTDRRPPEKYRKVFAQHGIEVIYPK